MPTRDNSVEPKKRIVALTEAEREARRRRLDELLAQMDALPKNDDAPDPLEWDENGLPI
jgi:hypothetical protein